MSGANTIETDNGTCIEYPERDNKCFGLAIELMTLLDTAELNGVEIVVSDQQHDAHFIVRRKKDAK